MQIQEAVEICVTKKYAEFDGCATRSEYWWFVLFLILISTLLGIAFEPLAGAFSLAMLVPYCAVGTRRLRDTGRSPWWWLLVLLPVIGDADLIRRAGT
jgi:uncharacterized membrane protein YhaH (DUF805 family)